MGIDDIQTELLKKLYEVLINSVIPFFNGIFDMGIYPQAWATSVIIRLHKKVINNPGNYCGVSLLSVMSKLYTHIL